MARISNGDLEHIFNHTKSLWDNLREQNIFITGGTGFIGHWLLESFAFINDRLKLNAHATVLSRDPAAFYRSSPHLANNPSVRLLMGDVCSFNIPEGEFRYVIHAATPSSAKLTDENPQLMFDTIVNGTRKTIEFAASHGTKHFLFTSSGAVYGKQPPELSKIPEDYIGAPDTLNTLSAYGEGKRAAEMLCAFAAEQGSLEIKIARCFAFVGPFLPLDIHFAIGNFIRDALVRNQITVKGNGTPYRSYLYAGDLAIWLWTILFKGQNCRPYNVGSENEISIADLALLIASKSQRKIEVKINQKPVAGLLPDRYVPSVNRAMNELGLKEYVDLSSAIDRTEEWLLGNDCVL